MKAVFITEFGSGDNLEFRDVPDPPKPQGTQVLIHVKAAGLNRADLLQRRGLYPPPPGYSPNIPGMEFAGEVVAVGENVEDFKRGDRVFGITGGEAQAELLLTDARILAHIPDNLTFAEAGSIPEAFITAHDAIITLGDLKEGESLLIHAVGSGVGLAGLQIAKAKGATVFGTSRTAEKLERCMEFGLDQAISTADGGDFSAAVLEKTGGEGVDVILDLVGAGFFQQNLASLALKGRLILVGLTSGATAEFHLSVALYKRLQIIGTSLRGRAIEEKAEATRKFADDVVPLLDSGEIRPNVDKTFRGEGVLAAYQYLESNESFGKVVLEF